MTSNEPVSGPGYGGTAPDWLVTGPLSPELRAERSGAGAGRVYTLRVECDDHRGNLALTSVEVLVPHHRH